MAEQIGLRCGTSAGYICDHGEDNRIPLDAKAAATVTFGRALTSDVRINLPHCSRLHAELRVDQNARVSLVNHAKAANATLLNAQPLAPEAARDVRDGDVIKICDRRFRFEAASAKRARVDAGDDDALLSGAADQKPPPTGVAPRDKPEKEDVDVDARSTELVGEEKPVGAEDVPEVTIVDEDEAWTRKGFLSKRGDVEATVAEAVAAVAKINGPKKKQNKDALEELKALEKKAADKTISTQDNRDFCKKWDLPLQGGKKEKIPGKLRTLLEKKQREMVGQQKLDGERAVLNTKLDLEMKAFHALADSHKKGVVGWLSVHACALLMDDASSDCLKKTGNVDSLVFALREAGLELVGRLDGEVLAGTLENMVLCVAYSLERALNALPPKEVAEGVLEQISSMKHAPRVDKAGCAALDASLRREARSFAAQDAASAAKVTPDLPPFPTRDARTLKLRQDENRAWSAAPPAARANVHLRMQYDSYALGTAAPLQKWPKWLGRPTIVADPLTDMDGVALAETKPIGVLAKKLVHGEKSSEGQKKSAG